LLASITRQARLSGFIIDVVDHCNLNCKYCSHVCPLVSEKFLSLEDFRKDLERMSELSNKNIANIGILGGEPLLHPELPKIFEIARTNFPKAKITVTTNGLLLLSQKDIFWNAINEHNITLAATRYPIKLDWAAIEKRAKSFGIEIDYQGLQYGVKTMFYTPFDLSGSQEPTITYLKCGGGNGRCSALRNGKFFTCSIPSTIHYFNEYFKQNLEVVPQDYIDIYKVKSIEEILDFLARPIPFCRYCNVDARTYKNKWEVSKKEISEWV
jgi:MoaA/NifB/PqqE/SkfB family radical SAM enzyme